MLHDKTTNAQTINKKQPYSIYYQIRVEITLIFITYRLTQMM